MADNTTFSDRPDDESIQGGLGRAIKEDAASGISDKNEFLSGWADSVNAIIDQATTVAEGEAEATEMLAMALMQNFHMPLNMATQLAQQQVQKFSDKHVDGAHKTEEIIDVDAPDFEANLQAALGEAPTLTVSGLGPRKRKAPAASASYNPGLN